jgi:hypothetical protein
MSKGYIDAGTFKAAVCGVATLGVAACPWLGGAFFTQTGVHFARKRSGRPIQNVACLVNLFRFRRD